MATRTNYVQVTTNKTPEEIRNTTMTAFRALGGAMKETATGFQIVQGAQGVRFAFTAKLSALIAFRQIKPDRYEIECVLQWSPNNLVWICLAIGFFVLGILWVIPVLYLFVNPVEAYQQALHRAQQLLE